MTPARNWGYLAERLAGYAVFGKRVLKLLIFLAIAWFVLRLLMPNYNILIHKHQVDKMTMHSVLVALSEFEIEYNKFPLRSDSDSDLSTATGSTLLLPLLAQDPATNPRNIRFIDLASATNGRPGLTNNPLNLVDSWDQPYHIILDTNNDGMIANPEAGMKPRAESTLKFRAAIYSSGPDRDPKTWKDNITTWR